MNHDPKSKCANRAVRQALYLRSSTSLEPRFPLWATTAQRLARGSLTTRAPGGAPAHPAATSPREPAPALRGRRRGSALTGPNTGYAYIPGEESFLNIREPWLEINGILLDAQHEFWKGRPECDVPRLHDEAVAHERTHYDLVRESIDAGYTRGWLESFVAYGTLEQLAEEFQIVLNDFDTALRNAGDMGHTSPRFTPHHCDPLLNPGHRRPAAPARPTYP
jgi:hypothetical protein